ncbi:MAG: serine/threonine protein kinase [Lentisphaeraceae bacterium]|nr:serine/threonine protein kinase [Lentisphaeraceae bacterium]
MNENNKKDTQDCEVFFEKIDDSLTAFCDQSLTDFSDEELRQVFPIQSELSDLTPQYLQLDAIGYGGMKQITRVLELKGKREVAMAKLLQNKSAKPRSKEEIERFFREARLTASLQHPNILPVYDIGFDKQGEPFFTMELLKGENLSTIIKKINRGESTYVQKYTRAMMLDIFSRICDALAYAHSRQVIHLDLKPENINIGFFGEVIVIDWGLAKILTDDEEVESGEDFNSNELDANELNHVTIAGAIKGTPGFMAPEQVKRYGTKDIRSDIYSLGAILYCCLSGQAPIDGETLEEILRKTEFGQLSQAGENGGSKLPSGLDALVQKALAVDPERRYQDIKSLRRDLDNFLHGFATEAEEAGLITQLILLAKRHKKMLCLTIIFTVILSVSAIISFKRISDERLQAQRATAAALEAKGKAQEQQAKAERNLALFHQEQRENKALKNELEELFYEIVQSADLSSAQRKIALLGEGLKREKNTTRRQAMWHKKAVLHFVLQEFHLAQKSFAQLNKKPKLLRYAQWAGALKSDQQNLSDLQLAQLFRVMGGFHVDMVQLMYYKHMKNRDRSDFSAKSYLPLATVMLNLINNIWDRPRHHKLLLYSAGKLDLSGRKYRRLRINGGYGINILAPLKIHDLDLSHTGFFELSQLAGLKFHTLNFAGCKLNPITLSRCNALKKFNIKTIIYDSRFLQKQEIELLQKYFDCQDLAPK